MSGIQISQTGFCHWWVGSGVYIRVSGKMLLEGKVDPLCYRCLLIYCDEPLTQFASVSIEGILSELKSLESSSTARAWQSSSACNSHSA